MSVRDASPPRGIMNTLLYANATELISATVLDLASLPAAMREPNVETRRLNVVLLSFLLSLQELVMETSSMPEEERRCHPGL
mmetsp:Transcript_35432/g.64920  ORF Transcript_35432/g.64920 Transcript_35432/m.64920 type:complete len:82 (-) Transcript_35432:152-397(-)